MSLPPRLSLSLSLTHTWWKCIHDNNVCRYWSICEYTLLLWLLLCMPSFFSYFTPRLLSEHEPSRLADWQQAVLETKRAKNSLFRWSLSIAVSSLEQDRRCVNRIEQHSPATHFGQSSLSLIFIISIQCQLQFSSPKTSPSSQVTTTTTSTD